MFRNHGEEVKAALDGTHPALQPDVVLPDGTQVEFKTQRPCTCTLACIPQSISEDQYCKESASCQARTYDDLVTAHEKEMQRLRESGEEVHGP